jgi:uncharacterized membrane protein (DUF106 family)
MIVLIGLLLMASVLYLAKSYNNLFKGFRYEYLPDAKELYKHKKDLKNYNRKVKKAERESFKEYLIENYANLSSTNMKINRSRLDYLYVAKTLVFIALVLTIVLMFSYMVVSLNN